MSRGNAHPAPEDPAQVIIVAREGLFRGEDVKRLLAELSLRNPWKKPGGSPRLWAA